MKTKLTSIYQKIYTLTKRPMVARIINGILPFRLWIIVSVHLAIFALSYMLTFLLLREKVVDIGAENLLWRTILPLVFIRLAVFWYHDLHQGLWRFVSFEDLLNIIRAAVISSVIFVTIGIIWEPMRIPQSMYVLDWILCVMLCGGIRFSVRNFREKIFPGPRFRERDNVLVVGPVEKVHPLVKDIISDPHSHYNAVGIVDPTKEDRAGLTRVIDVPVWSLQQAVLRKSNFRKLSSIVLCWPESSRKQLETVVDELKSLQVPFKTIPHFEDILSDKVTINDIRDVEIEDLLERPPVRIEMERISDQLQDKVVLVTGGGGSIGSELCRQIAGFNPRLLVILDRSENSLFDLELELQQSFPDVPLHVSVSTINNYLGLKILMSEMKVEFVYHAAAYKHVPLMESAPIECAYNNILGTHNLTRASLEAGVKNFVMISTDKAVSPTNVMGVTKRIAEMVVQSHNGNQTKFITVRFGNVLGSAGSVTPLFKRQIAVGGPVTVTHPEIERFFMTIPEAVQLVLQASSMGRGGEIFVLEMGKPVKILHLAEKLITLSGKKPYEDIEINFTGLRPGEKMYEELFNHSEEQIPTSHAQIRVAISQHLDLPYIKSQIEEIRGLIVRRDGKNLREKFRDLVPQYCSQSQSSSSNAETLRK